MKSLVVERLWTHLSKGKKNNKKKDRKERRKEEKKEEKEKKPAWFYLVSYSYETLFFPIIAFSCTQPSPFSFPLTSWTLSIVSLVENASLPHLQNRLQLG